MVLYSSSILVIAFIAETISASIISYPIQKKTALKKGNIKKVQVTEWLKGLISLWGKQCYHISCIVY